LVEGADKHRPLPVDEELRPQRGGQHQEGAKRAAERAQAGADLTLAGLLEQRAGPAAGRRERQREAGQADVGQPGPDAAPGHVEGAPRRARPFGYVGYQELGELGAVAVPPCPGVPAQQAAGPAAGIVGVARSQVGGLIGRAHAVPQ